MAREAVRIYWRLVRSNTRQEATGADERLTDDDCVVVSDEHFAVDVDELCDQASLQLSVSTQAGDGDVVHPLVVHWRGKCKILHCITTEDDTRNVKGIKKFDSLTHLCTYSPFSAGR